MPELLRLFNNLKKHLLFKGIIIRCNQQEEFTILEAKRPGEDGEKIVFDHDYFSEG